MASLVDAEGKERAEEIAEGFAEFAEGDKAKEKSGNGEDGKEVAEDEGDAVELRPVHLVGQLPRREW